MEINQSNILKILAWNKGKYLLGSEVADYFNDIKNNDVLIEKLLKEYESMGLVEFHALPGKTGYHILPDGEKLISNL